MKQLSRTSHKAFVPPVEMCRDKDEGVMTSGREAIRRWKQHYYEHLNFAEGPSAGNQDSGRNDNVSTAEDRNKPTPTLNAIQQLKINKASGKDGIEAELIKIGPEKLSICLHRLIV